MRVTARAAAIRRRCAPPATAPAGIRRYAAAVLAPVCMLAGCTAGAAEPRKVVQVSGWREVWHDEFNGTGVDAAKWTVRNNAVASNEKSVDTSRQDNVRVTDGRLELTALREQHASDDGPRQYTSGYLDSIGHRSFRYGRFEIRARLPLSVGLWPAFWLRADRGPGEIDALEAVGGLPTSVVQTVHESTNGGKGKVGRVSRLPAGTIADWHTYGVQVSRQAVRWTVDGRTTLTVTTRQAPWLVQTFDQPLNLRMNLQVGGSLPDFYRQPVGTASIFPARYEIDWVRVYQYRTGRA